MTLAAALVCAGWIQNSAMAADTPGSRGLPAWAARHLTGQAAVNALGDRLPDVAAEHRMEAEHFKRILLEDPTAMIDGDARLLYVEPELQSFEQEAAETVAEPAGTLQGSIPLEQTFLLHSRKGASKLIYLDFDGHRISGSAWNSNNGGADIIAPPWDIDGNPSSFGTAERTAIQNIWKRVAEDYAAFDVDVTTEYPGEAALTRSSTSDYSYGMRVLVSAISQYFGRYGGIAYVGVYATVGDTYKPALVFPENLANNEKYIAEACTHEAGHTLGLSHDGTSTGTAYYSGHGTGETGWAPIMGTGYYKNLTQWSKGEYANANNKEDDLAKIAGYVGYLPDDYGNTLATSAVFPAGASPSASGLIGAAADVDVFKFTAGAGSATFTVYPADLGPNLDVLVSLHDSSGGLLASANGADVLGATVSTYVNAGTYYVKVAGTGKGDPLTTGYSSYSSMGAYDLVGSIVATVGNVAPNAVIVASPTSGTAPLTVSFSGANSSDPDGSIASYAWNFGDGTGGSGAQVSHVYQSAGTYTATLTVSDNAGATSSATVTIVVGNTVVSTTKSCSVGRLELTVSTARSGDTVTATVKIVDATGAVVPSATVTGNWSGVVNGSSSAVTAYNGVVSFTSRKTKASGTLTFTVTDVQKSGYYYVESSSSTAQVQL